MFGADEGRCSANTKYVQFQRTSWGHELLFVVTCTEGVGTALDIIIIISFVVIGRRGSPHVLLHLSLHSDASTTPLGHVQRLEPRLDCSP